MTRRPLELVPCQGTEEEARLVMTWRNDPVTLQMFYHRQPKRWPDFWHEFGRDYFTDPTLPPAFAIDDQGRRVAFLRFQRVAALDGSDPTADISINVDPGQRGRGLGVVALLGAREYLAARGVSACLAEVRVENAASRRAFERAGWRLHDEVEKHIADTGERCRVLRFHRSLP